jgi:hypothetical protein
MYNQVEVMACLFLIMGCVMKIEVLLSRRSQYCVSSEGPKLSTMACHLYYFDMSFVIKLSGRES